MKVKIVFYEPKCSLRRHQSAAHDRILKQQSEKKSKQIEDAVNYCIENSCRGYKALKTGNYPLIKDARTINGRLDGLIKNGEEKKLQRILTISEEEELLRHVQNKNRYLYIVQYKKHALKTKQATE